MRFIPSALHCVAASILALTTSLVHATDVKFSVNSAVNPLDSDSIRGSFAFSDLLQGALQIADVKAGGIGPDVVVPKQDGAYASVNGMRIMSVVADVDTSEVKSLQLAGGFRVEAPAIRENGKRNAVSTGGWMEITDLGVDYVHGAVTASIKGANGLGSVSNFLLWQFSPGSSLPKGHFFHPLLLNPFAGACEPGIFNCGLGTELLALQPASTSSLTITQSGFGAISQAMGLTPNLGVPAMASVSDFGTIGVTAVPEPSEWAMVAIGLACVGATRRKKPAPGATRVEAAHTP